MNKKINCVTFFLLFLLDINVPLNIVSFHILLCIPSLQPPLEAQHAAPRDVSMRPRTYTPPVMGPVATGCASKAMMMILLTYISVYHTNDTTGPNNTYYGTDRICEKTK